MYVNIIDDDNEDGAAYHSTRSHKETHPSGWLNHGLPLVHEGRMQVPV